MIRWKLLFDGQGMTFFIVEEVNVFKGIFVVKKMSKCLSADWDSYPSPGFPIKL